VRANAKNETVGERLKRLRLARGLSQRQLAGPGVSYPYISRIEANARAPSVKALRQLARKLGVSVEYLETGREVPEADERELRIADAELKLRLGDDLPGVEREIEQILGDARVAGDRVSAVRALFALGLAAFQSGRALEAVERLEAALGQERANPILRPDVYGTLAQAYVALGAPDRAVKVLEDCLEEVLKRAPDDGGAQIRFATLLSYALTDAGDYGRAREIVTDALARAPDDADPYTRVRLYWSRSRLAGIEGQLTESLEYIRRAIALLEATEDTLTLARAHLLAANVEVDRGEEARARGHVKSASELLGPSPDTLDLGMLRVLEAQLERDAERSADLAREAIAVFGEQHAAERGAAIWTLAGALARQEKTDSALDAYAAAVDLLSIHGRLTDAAKAAGEWADLLHAAGRVEGAEEVLKRAESLRAATHSSQTT
jgi:transcriptional regulator with XRE-family HTH domain